MLELLLDSQSCIVIFI